MTTKMRAPQAQAQAQRAMRRCPAPLRRCAPATWLLGGLALLLSAAPGCADKASYTYIDVHVRIDSTTVTNTQLSLVTACEAQVLGVEVSQTLSLPCRENRVSYEVGTFQWTSKAKAGELRFVVRVLAVNQVVVGETTSEPITVMPGKHLTTTVVVKGLIAPGDSDGGADAVAPQPDAAMDAAAPVDGTTGSDGAVADGPVPDVVEPSQDGAGAGAIDGSGDVAVPADAAGADTPSADANGDGLPTDGLPTDGLPTDVVVPGDGPAEAATPDGGAG